MERTKEGKEYLNWSKERALQSLEQGSIANAWASMLSDLSSNEELLVHPAIQLGNMLLVGGHLSTKEAMKKFIEDFE